MLLERGEELSQLQAAVDRARRMEGALVLMSGEAGIGKTSLVRAFADQVGNHVRVLYGGCEDLLAPRPLGPFRDMFRSTGPGSPPELDRTDRDGYIEALLAEMAFSLRPALIIIDDAHWADDASLDIIRYLGRRVDQLAAVLVVTYRTGELIDDHPLRRVLGALTGPATLRLELKPLSDAAVTSIAGRAGVDPAGLVTAVAGNPFYLTEALAAPGSAVPATVRDTVIARVRCLPKHAQRALEVLSVVPHEAEVELLTVVIGGISAVVLEDAERLGMVAVSGDRVRFRHELARRAVEQSLQASRRIELNRLVLAALERAAAESPRLVHHAVAAADWDAVARFATAAADEAATAGAQHEALTFALLALEHEGHLAAETAARMDALAGYALYALNRFGEAAAHADNAVRRWQALGTAPVEFAQALLLRSRMRTMLGEPALARADLTLALRTLDPLGPSPDLAHAYGMMGNLDAVEGQPSSAVEWCRLALDAADEFDRVDVAAHARIYLGVARAELGDTGGLTDLRIALDLARDADHGDYQCRAAVNLAVAMIWLGRHPETVPFLEIAENVARDRGLDYHLFHVRVHRSQVDLFSGRWDAAERTLREQVGTSRDPAAVMVIPLSLLGRLLARRGDPAAAGLVDRAWQLAARSRQVHRVALAGGAMVESAWLRGDADAVRAVAAGLLPMAARVHLGYLRGEMLRYLARIGDPVEPFAGCPAGFRYGMAGDWKSAAAAWAEVGNPYEEALELSESPDLGRAFDALRRLDDLGATGTARVVRQLLRQRGVEGVPRGPQRTTRDNPARLTARQVAVLALLAEGLTSAEIAERMYVSRRTVDNHVQGILSRLAVPSRRDAVAIAVERRWLEHSRSE